MNLLRKDLPILSVYLIDTTFKAALTPAAGFIFNRIISGDNTVVPGLYEFYHPVEI